MADSLARFYRPGRAIVRWLQRAIGAWSLDLLEIFAPAQITACAVAQRFTGAATWPLGWAIEAALFQVLVSYLVRTQKKLQEVELADVKGTALAMLKRHKQDATGNLSQLLKLLLSDEKNESDIRYLQTAFLAHAVDVAKETLGHGSSWDHRIAASWVIPVDDFSEFKTVAYDRNRADRSPGKRRPILPGIPGAPEAFLTGKTVLIADTRTEAMRTHFPDDTTYGTILSIPVRVLNLDDRDRVIGVMSLDCEKSGDLTMDLEYLVKDVAYVIGLCETFFQDV